MSKMTFEMPEGFAGPVVVHVVLDTDLLAREIASRLASDALLDASDIASLIKCSPRYLAEEVSRSPGFPKAIRFTGPNGRRSNARWQRRDIIEWIESQKTRSKHVGRPRKKPELNDNVPWMKSTES